MYADYAEAEVLMLENPTEGVSVGDRLFYVAESSFATMDIDKKTRCYAYREFTDLINEDIAREQNPQFGLALFVFAVE